MLSGATRAHLAILVVDATAASRKTQASWFFAVFSGFKKCIVCINKIDLLIIKKKFIVK
jgi:sulfate adenylyltransferase subunit 1 (EFTu-like GTPase family)